MKASEALLIGDKLRPVAYQDRFCNVEGRGLCSDAWGAICEAVQPAVANFNWNPKDRFKFERAMDAFVAVQTHYFAEYFKMPCRCPGSTQRFQEMGGRIINQDRKAILKTYDDYAKVKSIGAITSECDKVQHLAGMIDHLFYAHRWERPQIAEVVGWYEQARQQGQKQQLVINRNFTHYAANYR